MNKEEIDFEILLYDITSKVIEHIIEFKKLEENIAIEMFLKSKVYSLLENEKTKIWQYSPLTIAMLYIDESMNKLNLSEV